MLANIQDLTSFKNHLINNEIDETKSLLARKQAAIKDVTRTAKITLENLPRDDLRTSLIPEDVTVKQGEHMLALEATPNGDCLFNAASILLCGHESLSTLLRLLVPGNYILMPHFMLTMKHLVKLKDQTPNSPKMFCS